MSFQSDGGTVLASLSGSVPVAYDPRLQLELRENALWEACINPQLVISGVAGVSHTFADLTSTHTASAVTSDADEGAVQSTLDTEMTTASRTATAAMKAAFIRAGFLTADSTSYALDPAVRGILARAGADLMDTDVLALLGSFSSTQGSTGVDLTGADMRAAIAAFSIAAKSRRSSGMIVLHDTQVTDWIADASSGVGGSNSSVFVNSDLAQWFQNQGPNAGVLSNYMGTYQGIPVLKSTNVGTANAGADRAGAIFARDGAIGGVVKWEPQVDLFDAGATMGLHFVWRLLLAYGFVELKDALGISIITDA